MILDAKKGDVVLNYYRFTVYKYNPENLEHKKDSFRCRFATHQEIKEYKKADKEVIKINDLNIRIHNTEKWLFKERYAEEYKKMTGKYFGKELFTINFDIDERMVTKLMKVSRIIKTTDYYQVIDYALNNQNGTFKNSEYYKENKALKAELKELKHVVKQFFKLKDI